ncbi:MAG TPA: tRNA pseudouridine(55) synthase TruB [Chitinophagaceae bacterium]|nr:tRNA pseudouridine(55) synthase TruB [Chitinophagaceae bacterium]
MEENKNISLPANEFAEGKVLLINKPFQWTSFDVVKKIRYLVKTKKVGHAGTLDPLATGLLIVCTGKFTKKINDYMAQEKEYTGSFTLGATTPTFDMESKPENFKPVDDISEKDIHAAARKFIGEIMQIPPAHSAIKVGGKRVYELARKGEEVKLKSREIFIKEFDILKIEMPVVYFRVVCSTGTYIRSLANDFGEALRCGAYLLSLTRTRIGDFRLEDAISIESFEKKVKQG